MHLLLDKLSRSPILQKELDFYEHHNGRNFVVLFICDVWNRSEFLCIQATETICQTFRWC